MNDAKLEGRKKKMHNHLHLKMPLTQIYVDSLVLCVWEGGGVSSKTWGERQGLKISDKFDDGDDLQNYLIWCGEGISGTWSRVGLVYAEGARQSSPLRVQHYPPPYHPQ